MGFMIGSGICFALCLFLALRAKRYFGSATFTAWACVGVSAITFALNTAIYFKQG